MVTAAHCLYDYENAPLAPGDVKVIGFLYFKTKEPFYKVRLGEHDLKKKGETSLPELDLNVTAIHRHENYTKENTYRYTAKPATDIFQTPDI